MVGIDKVTEANGSEAYKGVVQAVNIGPVTFYKVENNRWQQGIPKVKFTVQGPLSLVHLIAPLSKLTSFAFTFVALEYSARTSLVLPLSTIFEQDAKISF